MSSPEAMEGARTLGKVPRVNALELWASGTLGSTGPVKNSHARHGSRVPCISDLLPGLVAHPTKSVYSQSLFCSAISGASGA